MTLVRESGTADEDTAGRYIVDRLQALGVPVTLHTPELYISLPERAELTVAGADGHAVARTRGRRRWRGRPATTPVDGEIVYVPSRYAAGTAIALRRARRGARQRTGRRSGRAAASCSPRASRCRGRCRPSSAAAPSRRSTSTPASAFTKASARRSGARRPPSRIGRKPTTPVVCINHPDGEALIADVQRGPVRASIRTWLREGWMRCLLPVVEIRGQEDPDEFLLVHGHYDSWYEGIGDNATGDAALLELARVLWTLARSPEAQRAHRVVARATRPAATPGRRGTPTPSPTRSTSTASPSSTSTRRAAPTPPPTRK